MDVKEFLTRAGNVKPSKRQLEWFNTEFYGFVHFSPNTYTGLEWGLGNEDPQIFNPTKFDPNQWVEAFKSAGIKGLILTAKHHDGFCLWPSKHTEHSIKNSPFKDGKGDIVKEVSDACRNGGIKFGFYLSPWDRNSKYYGTPEYNEYYKLQLTELLTNYGEIFHVWFDNACGEGKNGKKQEYDFQGFIELIRKYQPNATIFNDHGPDVRWCGNESGSVRYAEWSVVPKELCWYSEAQTKGTPLKGDISHIYNDYIDIGALSNILYSDGLVFCGSEVDMSIRDGWFYHENEEPHSLERLFNTYISTVGGNCCFNLNVPPNKDGLFDEKDVTRLRELGDKINNTFSKNIANEATIQASTTEGNNIAESILTPDSTYWRSDETQGIIHFTFDDEKDISYITIKENIANGQRVETFIIEWLNDGGWSKCYFGTCIGHKKICQLNNKIHTNAIRIIFTSARDNVEINHVGIY